MCFVGGGGGGDNGAAEARAREEARQARIRQGIANIDDTFGRFDDQFFADRAKAYTDFATPQLDDQLADTRKQLIFALSRGGNLNSSTGAERFADFRAAEDRARRQIESRGLDYANQARTDVERQRADLISILNATSDPEAAASGAVNRVQALSATPAFDPFTATLGNLTAGLTGEDKAGRREISYGRTRLFSVPKSSSSIVR
ncbi:MAG: hypothetical protein CMM50_01195 [Rhodospirillaceae bacterium]|nr:hypothetical protein [Rhodospirillaceae bacterium]